LDKRPPDRRIFGRLNKLLTQGVLSASMLESVMVRGCANRWRELG